MAKAGISLHVLKERLNRVEAKLQAVEARFTALDSSLETLAQKFKLQEEILEEETGQEVPWRLGSEEEEQRAVGRRERRDGERRGGAGGQRQGGRHCGRLRPCLPPGPGAAAPPPPSCSSLGAGPVL